MEEGLVLSLADLFSVLFRLREMKKKKKRKGFSSNKQANNINGQAMNIRVDHKKTSTCDAAMYL